MPPIKRRGAKVTRKNQNAIDAYKAGDRKRLRRELRFLRAAAKNHGRMPRKETGKQ